MFTGRVTYVQRHLPTGGVEIHFPIGGRPQLVGPLTGPAIEVIPAGTTIVGVRFQPFRHADRMDRLVREAVRVLMPWHPVNIDVLATQLALSVSQLRRRCLHAVGTSPKVLQRTLRSDRR